MTVDPARHAIPKWWAGSKWHIPMAVMRRNRVGGLADIMGLGKILCYSHRLMHRKRVTCELHDSYFRLMTIKHAIPKIEWAIELLYNSVWTGSQWVGVRWVRDKVRLRKPSSSRELDPRASGWAALENEKDTTLMDIRVGVSILQFCSVSNSFSHLPFQIKWEVYFFKEVFTRLVVALLCSAWICIVAYLLCGYTTYLRVLRCLPSGPIYYIARNYRSQLA